MSKNFKEMICEEQCRAYEAEIERLEARIQALSEKLTAERNAHAETLKALYRMEKILNSPSALFAALTNNTMRD